ncbi:hypothetical protein KCV01_g18974, partial [Aureobasidium melanogenum]
NAPYGEMLSGWYQIATVSEPHFVDGCDTHARIPFQGRMDSAGLKRYGSVVVGSYQYTAFEDSFYPNSPLLIFQHATSPRTGGISGNIQPVWDLESIYNPGFNPPAGGAEGRSSTFYVAVVARGGPMRSLLPTTIGNFVSWPSAYPSLKINAGLTATVNVAQATCSLGNRTVRLPDVPASALPAIESYAGETPFDITMYCDANSAYSARMTIGDALNPSSTAYFLSATAESTTRGVVLQIGRRDGSDLKPLFMGSSWTESAKQGTNTIPLFARYYRTAGDARFQAGDIGGRATLTLTYF